jgi:ribosomal-protein-alanine N-acetyltransferase
MDFPTLHTERLILREWQESDAAHIYEIFRHESVIQYTAVEPYTSPDDGLKRVEGSRIFFHEKNLGIVWGIFERESGKVLGDIDFTWKDKRDFRVQLGCCFAPLGWGKGFAFEAMKEVIRYAFEDFQLFKINRLEAGTDPRNISAQKLLEKLGFQQEALLHDYYFEHGKFVDQHIYGLLRYDWERISIEP